MIPAHTPIKIVTVEIAGGACPYQIEATTDKGEYFYMRYCRGRLRAGISPTEKDFKYDKNSYNVFNKQIGDPWDGWVHHEDFSPLMEGIVLFPEGFKFESYL